MATGQNIQQRRGIEVSNIAPQVNLDTGEAENWQRIGVVADKFTEANKPNLMRRAAARGQAEGLAIAAGEQEYSAPRFQFGEAAAARQAALETAYNARTRQDIDAREREVRREFRYDPDGYKTAMNEVVSGFIQGAPSDFAVDVEGYAQGKASEGLTWVADQRAARDEQETVQATASRAATLQERMIALAAQAGGPETMEYMQAEVEYTALQNARESNPAILYSEEQRLADDQKLTIGITTSMVGRDAVEVYRASGGGLPGLASGARHLREQLLEGDLLANLTPEAKSEVYRDANRQLRDLYTSDALDGRVQEEAERAAREERRELVGDYRLRITLGEATEADVMADTTLNDADKATLVNGIRARDRRDAADVRATAAAERSNDLATYNQFRDDADAGTLDRGELADAVSSVLLSPGQARTLQNRTDRAIRPLVDDVMTEVRARARRPGMNLRPDTNANLARAEEGAGEWIRENPNATLEQRLQAGRWYADRYFGGAAAGTGGTAANAEQARAARIRAVNADIAARRAAGRPYSSAEAARLRNQAQGR